MIAEKRSPGWKIFVVLLMAMSGPGSAARAQSERDAKKTADTGPQLTLIEFLDQVAEQHDDFKSAREAARAAQLRGQEAHLALSPSLFGSVQRTDDQKPNFMIQADKSLIETYQLGVSQMTSIGLSGRLYYNVQDFKYMGLNMTGVPPEVHEIQASPVLELTLPLWRNWWGGETRSQLEQGDSQARQSFFTQNFRQKSVLVQAGMSYWNLALSRESVRVAQDAVERNRQLVKWHDQRARNGLGDRVDLLQAQAALQNSLINLKIAQDNETSMSRSFNLARGRNSNEVSEKLMPMTAEYVDRLKIPERQDLRDDVRAAQEQARAAQAAAELSRQRYLPTLELYGSAAMNNANPLDTSAAYSDSFRADRPTQTIGLRVNAPLDFGLASDTRLGWEKEKLATELSYRRKLLEQDNDWHDLVDRFKQAQERFRLYQELEQKQKEKYDYERARRTAGRTTTQQVLLFETDFEQAQLSRIRALSDLFLVYAQMKLYEGGPNESR